MKVAYISPSSLPSRAANAVHVVHQCNGFAQAGCEVTLYAKRTVEERPRFAHALTEAYGVASDAFEIVTYFSESSRGDSLRIAALALRDLARRPTVDVVLSRNLYASYYLALAKRRFLFETHQIETGVRRHMQKFIMTRPGVRTVLISDKQLEFLLANLGEQPKDAVVLHDAAPDGIAMVPAESRRQQLAKIVPIAADGEWRAVCGYFGHLYSGRGIEIIEAMAHACPDVLFLVYGGNEADVEARRKKKHPKNLCYMGYVSHASARALMTVMDVLLMPYQRSVSIGVAGHDTAGWMSPMKMFEYLASGVPIISSDLPVLREVLRDGENCLLVDPENIEMWVGALNRTLADAMLAQSLGTAAHNLYRAEYTWRRRAEKLLSAAHTQ